VSPGEAGEKVDQRVKGERDIRRRAGFVRMVAQAGRSRALSKARQSIRKRRREDEFQTVSR
jgi:hypothetical protein